MSTVIAEWPASSPQLNELFEAHSKALGQLKNAPRTCISHFAKKDKAGKPIPDYADLATILDTIRKPLADNGLSVTQCFFPYDETQDVLITTLSHKSGQFTRSFTRIKSTIPPQQYAAAATYMKRAALAAIVGVAADSDDDGETADRTAAVASVDDEARIEKLGLNKIREAKTADERADVLAKAEARVSEGTLTAAALERLRAAATALDSSSQKTTAKKQMASAT